MKIALMISMKHGMRQFIFRDIKMFRQKGHEVTIFSIQYKKGLFNPLPDWPVVVVSWLGLILAQIWFFLRKPGVYLNLLSFALKTKSLVDFVIAIHFVDKMKDVDVIYSYFGDHKLFIAYYCKRILGKPLVTSIQAYELHKNPNPELF